MARIAGINIPDNKRIVISLTYIFGIGYSLSTRILKEANINPNTKAASLKPDELNKIRERIEKQHVVEGSLKRELISSVRRLRDIGTWRGMRHTKRLPVRGQRTKTNNRTVRGNVRRTMGSGKRPAASPT